MQIFSARTWLAALMLVLSSPVWSVDHTVHVGGTMMGGGGGYYGGGGSTPILGYAPPSITINAGDSVTFMGDGGASHNVVADDGSFRCANGCDGDGHGGNGAPSAMDWSATVTFNTPGTFGYHCEVHGTMGGGMVGSVTVNGTTPANVQITSGFTGAWYDPNQSGHGIFLEVLPGTPSNTLLAWWFAFTPDGTQQSWFGGLGPIIGNSATVTDALATGGSWIPNFNPASIVQNPWGTLTFAFTDCDHGLVTFNSTFENYGTNQMNLTRLTEPVACP